MAFTLAGYYDSIDPAGSYTPLSAIPDPHLTVVGENILVPALSQLVAAAAVIDLTVPSQARLSAPSMLEGGFPEYLTPLNSGLTFGSPPRIHDRSDAPLALTPVEDLKAEVLTNPASAVGHYVLVWLADGPLTPVTGNIRTVRATGAATLSAGAWVNTSLTFPVSLKAGVYQVVGMRVSGDNLVAARLVFPGSAWRPGAPAVNDEADVDYPLFRAGRAGVWGEFAHSSPPTLDCLGVTDTSQEVYLDLIYLG